MNIQLPTGLTISVSAYEYLFLLKEDEVDMFFQECIADNLGSYIEDPFSGGSSKERIKLDEIPDAEDDEINTKD